MANKLVHKLLQLYTHKHEYLLSHRVAGSNINHAYSD